MKRKVQLEQGHKGRAASRIYVVSPEDAGVKCECLCTLDPKKIL